MSSESRAILCSLTILFAAQAASAQPDAPTKPKPPPYSLPWQLRPVVPGNVVRSDTTVGFYEGPTTAGGTTVASMLLVSYKVIPELAPLVRMGVVSSSPPVGDSGGGFTNPVVGALYGPKLHPDLKLGLFLGVALPFGSGGGDNPDPETALAMPAGIPARSAMDNAMFAVNYLTVFPGVGFAYVAKGFTAQVEATLLQLTKTRGPDLLDDSNTNFTMGVHIGMFMVPELSFGAEIRHQRWLSTPTPVELDTTETLRDTTTYAIGPRFHLKLGETMWLRPGVAFAVPLDRPMAGGKYKVVQFDVPFAF